MYIIHGSPCWSARVLHVSNLETGARSKEKSAVSPREKNRVFRLEMKPFQFPHAWPTLRTRSHSPYRRVGKGAGAWAWTGRRVRKIGGFLRCAEVTRFSTVEPRRGDSRSFNASFLVSDTRKMFERKKKKKRNKRLIYILHVSGRVCVRV